MKIIFTFFASGILLFFTSITVKAQDINVHYMIGKKQTDVIKKYGNPVHRDDSSPEMICMFYKNKLNTMIFVSNKKGVYQSEALKSYDSKAAALRDLDDCIARSVSDGYSVDTVTTSDFRLRNAGVKADLQMSDNKLSAKVEIRMKANKSED